MRSGTLNVPGIVGLGAAAAIASDQWEEDAAGMGALRNRLERTIMDALDGVLVGHAEVDALVHLLQGGLAHRLDANNKRGAARIAEQVQQVLVLRHLQKGRGPGWVQFNSIQRRARPANRDKGHEFR